MRGIVGQNNGGLVVHGGGPQATALSRRMGHEPRIVAGRRVTDEFTALARDSGIPLEKLDTNQAAQATNYINQATSAKEASAGAHRRPAGRSRASGLRRPPSTRT